MKKRICLPIAAIILSLLFSLAGCSHNKKGSPGTESSPAETASDTALNFNFDIQLDFDVQYIRTNGTHNGVEHFIIRTKDQLDAYCEENKTKHDLERRENPAADSTIGFLDACDSYDNSFFENHALILVLLEVGSGSTRHKVTEVSIAGSEMRSRAAIKIDSIVPEVGTCDMAGWHILISVRKEHLPQDLDFITIYYDGVLINNQESIDVLNQFKTGLIVGYCGNTQTTIHFDSTNSYTFMFGNSVTLTEILRRLEYAPENLCRCMCEYTVDTEFGLGYGINLTEGFARYGNGQAALTQGQIESFAAIIDWAKEQQKQEVAG